MPVLTRTGSREPDPVRVGLVGLAATALALTVTFNLGAIQRLMGGSEYRATFSHAAGLRTGDPVRVSGLTVGRVQDVRIEGTGVTVTFDADDVRLGARTEAAIKTATVVGGRFLALTPAGSGRLERIPRERTSVPYDLTAALGDLSATTAELDVEQVAASLDAVAEVLAETPESFRGAISGVHRLATVVADRDEALGTLLEDAAGVSGVLADRSDRLTSLLSQGNALLSELVARRETIRTLLRSTRDISAQVSGAVEDNEQQIGPALRELDRVVDVLRANEDSITFMIDHVGGYTRNLGEAVGGGPFFYGYVANLAPTNLVPLGIEPDLLTDGGE